MLDKVKLLLGITTTDEDEILTLLIEMIQDYIVNYCHLSEYSTDLDNIAIQMVLQTYNKIGNAGMTSISSNGHSENYLSDYSEDILTQLRRHRKIQTA